MTPNTTDGLTVGAKVKILNSGYRSGRIVELRGPLGPGGARIYRVRVRQKPIPAYVEVREDQLAVVHDQGDGARAIKR